MALCSLVDTYQSFGVSTLTWWRKAASLLAVGKFYKST